MLHMNNFPKGICALFVKEIFLGKFSTFFILLFLTEGHFYAGRMKPINILTKFLAPLAKALVIYAYGNCM